jgi:hypothetical protein
LSLERFLEETSFTGGELRSSDDGIVSGDARRKKGKVSVRLCLLKAKIQILDVGIGFLNILK